MRYGRLGKNLEPYGPRKRYRRVVSIASRGKCRVESNRVRDEEARLNGAAAEWWNHPRRNAASLANVKGEFGKEVIVTSDAHDGGSQSSSAYINVCYDGLPYKWVPNYGPNEPGTVEAQGVIAELGPDAEAWLKELEGETGFELHQ